MDQSAISTDSSDLHKGYVEAICFYNDDPALPIYHWILTKGMATDGVAMVLLIQPNYAMIRI